MRVGNVVFILVSIVANDADNGSRRPGITGPPTSLPIGDNALLYLDLLENPISDDIVDQKHESQVE